MSETQKRSLKEVDHQFEVQFFEDVLGRDPNDVSVVELLANLYTRVGRIDDGLRMDRKLVRLRSASPVAHYNLACSLSLKNRKAEAIRSLRTAIQKGYRDWDWLMKDADLGNLRDDPRFRELLEEFEVPI